MTDTQPADPEFPETRSRLYRWLVRTEIIVAVVLLVALLALVALQVFTRFVLNAPLIWTEELARFTFVWFVFVAATFVTARRRNIVVQLYSARNTGRVMAGIDAFAALISAVVASMLAIGSVQLVMQAGHILLPASRIPQAVFYASAIVGFSLIAVHSLVNVYLSLRYPSQYVNKPVIDVEAID
ncbi:TRAP transporter small permease subunit [Microbacterium sp.]|uniref:TRAP transporter small permease n=1 Tax=Microbacterium sp. TaxID=51671 RepID=UPI002619CCA1|nr:TRAP transporter small permease subunit [Microbacterium sp.]